METMLIHTFICPKCGQKKVKWYIPDAERYAINCTNCGLISEKFSPTPESALRKWLSLSKDIEDLSNQSWRPYFLIVSILCAIFVSLVLNIIYQ